MPAMKRIYRPAFFFMAIAFLNCAFSAAAQEFRPAEGAFPFNVFSLDSDSPVSCADMNVPIDESRRIRVSADGHLEAGGKRIRIFGTNLSEVPEKENARFYARYLSALGYNCIRFHQLDADWIQVFLKRDSAGRWIINEEGLDKFDFFFNELKQAGIYSNINLLAGRNFNSKDGLPLAVNRIDGWKKKHCYGFWNGTALELQKKFASDILNRFNPYTKTTYRDDPAVAIVEINNENGMIASYLNRTVDSYPKSLYQELEEKWNSWLSANGMDFAELAGKFNVSGPQGKILAETDDGWELERHSGAAADFSYKGGEIAVSVKKNGAEPWHIQLNRNGIGVASGNVYTLTFEAAASERTELGVTLMQAHDPWRASGWSGKFTLNSEWKKFSVSFVCPVDDQNMRLTFGGLGFLEGKTVRLRNIKFQEGGDILYVRHGNGGDVALPKCQEFHGLPESYQKIVMDFLYDMEKIYWDEMRLHIKKTIGSKSVLLGTVIGCSPVSLMADFDMIDAHSYWYHPVFPGNSWNRNDYYVWNRTLTKGEFAPQLTGLATKRVFGKPFSVTEFDHPYPNQFSAEMYPMTAAFACMQDWDALFSFSSDLPGGMPTGKEKISHFFDQSANPVKTAAVPVAARIFRNFMVPPAEKSVFLEVSKRAEKENLTLYKDQVWNIGDSSLLGMEPAAALVHKIGVVYDDGEKRPFVPENSVSVREAADEIALIKSGVMTPGKGVFSDNRCIYIEEKSGIFVVQAPDATVSVAFQNSVFPAPEEFRTAGPVTPLVPSGDFASFAACRTDDGGILVFSAAWAGSLDEMLHAYKGAPGKKGLFICRDDIRLEADGNCGTGPVYALCGGGKFSVAGPDSAVLYPLNEKGFMMRNSAGKGNEFVLKSGGGTLWYMIEPSR